MALYPGQVKNDGPVEGDSFRICDTIVSLEEKKVGIAWFLLGPSNSGILADMEFGTNFTWTLVSRN